MNPVSKVTLEQDTPMQDYRAGIEEGEESSNQ